MKLPLLRRLDVGASKVRNKSKTVGCTSVSIGVEKGVMMVADEDERLGRNDIQVLGLSSCTHSSFVAGSMPTNVR